MFPSLTHDTSSNDGFILNPSYRFNIINAIQPIVTHNSKSYLSSPKTSLPSIEDGQPKPTSENKKSYVIPLDMDAMIAHSQHGRLSTTACRLLHQVAMICTSVTVSKIELITSIVDMLPP